MHRLKKDSWGQRFSESSIVRKVYNTDLKAQQ